MRRTRHVVLPVRSWQYTGLLIVSLACLTLGLVSRDREGQAGSLAGPDLQHGAPHKVDACPNEIVFNRLLFYDDLASDFGPILTDQEKQPTASSERVRPMNNREARESGKIRANSSVRRTYSAAASQRSTERGSRIPDGEKNLRFVRDHRSSERASLNRNSQSTDEYRMGNRFAEGNRDDEYQRSRSARSMNRDSGIRNLRVENQRSSEQRFSRISDQRSRTRRTMIERSSLERQRNREVRNVRSTNSEALMMENRAEGSRTRQIRNDRSDQRDSRSRNSQMAVDLSATRRTTTTASETGSSTAASILTNDRRIQRFSRSVRVHQSHVRNEARSMEDRNSRPSRSSERESRKESQSERRNRQIGSIRFNVRLNPSAELRDGRLNRQIREPRSIAGDSTSRDSRLAVEARDERLNRRASSLVHSDSAMNKRRLVVKRKPIALNGPIQNSRSLESDATQVQAQLTSQRRGDRSIRDARSFERGTTTRHSRVLRERESSDRRTDRRSSSRSDSRHQGSIGSSFERRDQQRAIRDSETRKSRLAEERREIRGARTSDFNGPVRNSRSLITRSGERGRRDIRAIQRDSRVTDVESSRDARYFDREFSVRYFMHAAVIRRLDTSMTRHRLGSVNRFEKHNRASTSYRVINERGSSRIMDGGDLMHRDELPHRHARVSAQKNNETTRRDSQRSRQIRDALGRVVSSRTLKNPQETEVTWADVTNSLTEGIASATKYDILEQVGVQLLCVVYCASLYSGKGGLSSIFFDRGNRFVVW